MSRVNMGPPPPPEIEPLPDWYGILELGKEASASVIRTAYKRLAFQYHPDKTLDVKLKPAMTKRFTEIQEAYEVLSDSRKKREYDEDLVLEAKIMEEYRRAQEMKERQARSRKAQQRNKQEEMIRKQEDRQAEMDYLAAKRQEDEQLRAAMQLQEARKQHGADQKRKTSTTAERQPENDRRGRKEEERRAKQETKRVREEEMHRLEAERREREKLQREEDKKQFAQNSEKRTRDRRQDRSQKDHMQFPIEDILPPETSHFDRPEKARDRGRSSKERLHDPTLHVPRDTSKVRDRSPRARDGSRHRERDRESDFSTRDYEPGRKQQFYESGARRVSTEPLHDEYLRAPGFGSPPHSYSIPRSATYSPQSSPKLRHSNPTMSTTHNFHGPNKGRDRNRDRPGERSRKHSEAGLYARDSFPSSIPEDINTSLPGNRDSGYSTSSAGTVHRAGVDPRLSSEKLDSKLYGNVNGKKYKQKMVYVTDSEDDASTIGKTRPKRATKQTSREDSHASYAPRHQPELDDSLLDDPFRYMQTGSKNFQYAHKDVNYGAKPSFIHTRSNSDHSSAPGPDITIDFINAGLAGMSTSHKSGRHAQTVGGAGGPTPGLNRYGTWAT